jgi:hypothetical protein
MEVGVIFWVVAIVIVVLAIIGATNGPHSSNKTHENSQGFVVEAGLKWNTLNRIAQDYSGYVKINEEVVMTVEGTILPNCILKETTHPEFGLIRFVKDFGVTKIYVNEELSYQLE